MPSIKNSIDAVLHDMETQQIVAVSQGLLERDDIIPMWYGEGDKIAPACVREAARKAIAAGDGFYAEKRGREELRHALNDYQKRLYGTDVGIDRLSLLASGVCAIQHIFQMILAGQKADNDNVVIVAPVWPNVTKVCQLRRAEVRFCLLKSGEGSAEGGGLYLDMDELASLIDGNTRAIFVNSPNNPSGWVMNDEEMRVLLELSRRHGVWLIADEVYNRITYQGQATPSFLSHITEDDLVIIVNSFSKSWCMTGWRAGWLVHPSYLGSLLGNLIEFNYSCVPGFIQQGCLAAFSAEGEQFVADLVDYCRAGRDVAVTGVRELPFVEEVASPQASFYLYFRLGLEMDDTLQFARRLAEEGGVGLAPGTAFGPGQEGWLRLCFAREAAVVGEAVDRMKRFFDTL